MDCVLGIIVLLHKPSAISSMPICKKKKNLKRRNYFPAHISLLFYVILCYPSVVLQGVESLSSDFEKKVMLIHCSLCLFQTYCKTLNPLLCFYTDSDILSLFGKAVKTDVVGGGNHGEHAFGAVSMKLDGTTVRAGFAHTVLYLAPVKFIWYMFLICYLNDN